MIAKFQWQLGLLALSSAICRGEAVQPPRFKDSPTGFEITRWAVLGPFSPARVTEDPFDDDTLKQIGIPGGEKNPPEILHFLSGSPRPPRLTALVAAPSGYLDLQDLYLRPRVAEAAPAVAYALCELEAAAPERRYLLIGSSDREKIWLNGRPVEDGRIRHGLYEYTSAVPLDLAAGANLLLIKVARYAVTWGLTARIEPSGIRAAQTALARQGMLESLLLARSVVGRGEPVILDPRGAPADTALDFRILGPQGNVAVEGARAPGAVAWSPDLAAATGLYRAEIRFSDGSSYAESFCLGDPAAVAADLLGGAPFPAAEPDAAASLDGLQQRLAILLKPDNRHFESAGQRRDWERKVAYTLSEIGREAALMRQGRDPIRGQAGLHMAGFISPLDGSSQYYRIFAPSTYATSGRPMPLAIMLPTTISASRPFLESAFMAAHSEAERMSAIAERHGLGLLWCGYREKPSGAPLEYAYFDEILAEAGRKYRIDPSRLYLLGACSAGAIGTMDAVRWPRRFAAAAFLNPVFRLAKPPSSGRDALFANIPGYGDWKADDNSVAAFLGLAGLPTYIIHDGAEPGHGDLAISQTFARFAQAVGYDLRFDRKAQGLAQHFSAWEDLIAWLSKQSRSAFSPEPAPGYFPAGDRTGSVADCFARPFVVVYGTGGDAEDQGQCRRIADAIARQWRAACFGGAVQCSDAAFDPKAFVRHNWILVGNPSVNRVWASTAGLPVRFEAAGLELRGRSFAGEGLA
ncbi:MAG TPA: hypothetical protein VHV47_06400, partial [Opitutaceae bacterium]|nr:hypothetical protein [Opitutaceae bacterium]